MTLETALVLPIFFFFFLGIFGFFGFIAARNQIHHALIQSAKSLSTDSYMVEKVDTIGSADFHWWENLSDMATDIYRAQFDQNYTSRTKWYDSNSNTDVVKKRFIAYLTGSGSDKEAQEKLETIGVKNGLKGIVFEYQVVNGDLIITLKYDLHLWVDLFGIVNIPMEDTVRAKMWGLDKGEDNQDKNAENGSSADENIGETADSESDVLNDSGNDSDTGSDADTGADNLNDSDTIGDGIDDGDTTGNGDQEEPNPTSGGVDSIKIPR